MKAYRVSARGHDPLKPSRLDFASPGEPVIAVAPTAEIAVRWAARVIPPGAEWELYELEVEDAYLVRADGTLEPSDGRWIEWGEGLKEAFVPLGEVRQIQRRRRQSP